MISTHRLFSFIVCLLITGAPHLLTAQPVTFTDVSTIAGVDDPESATGVAWGDYDNDGDEDILVANITFEEPPERKSLILYRNLGDGTFSDVTVSAGLDALSNWYHAIWGDYDNDGDLDIYASASFAGDSNHLYSNNGDGTFTEVGATAGVDDSRLSRGIAWGDYDNDGRLDLFVANTSGGANRLYKNNGDGTFTDAAFDAGVADADDSQGAVWGDYDNDGDLDLFVSDETGSLKLYHNNGTGRFVLNVNAAGLSGINRVLGMALGDYDNDEDLDLFLCDAAGGRLYRNNGNTTFSNVTGTAGVGFTRFAGDATWEDIDNDGWLDLYVVDPLDQDMLYYNNGNGTFSDIRSVTGLNGTGKWFGIAFGDYDNDGDSDLYMPVAFGTNRLYANDGNSNNWLHVKLVGGLSNRSGIGARVIAFTGIQRRRRDVDGGSGFSVQPSLPVEFGLGGATMVDSLIIYWPSGTVQKLTQIQTNQKITITEATTTSSSLTFTEIGGSVGVGDGGSGRGTAWGDYDNDGDQDLYLVNSTQRNRLYRNDGNTPGADLALATGVADNGSGFGAAWGDYDNDGDQDLYVARSGQTNLLYRNDSGNSFTEVGAASGVDDSDEGRAVAWGDYNRDGHLDLYVVNDGPNRLYRNNGNGTFTEVAGGARVNDNQAGQGAAWGDYDGDDYLDLYVSNGRSGLGFGEAPNRLYRNNRDGSFTEVGGFAGVNDVGNGRGVAWGDYDNDGDLDLYLANSDETLGVGDAPNRLYRNNGNGRFTEVGNAANVNDADDGQGVGWGDYDNDGWLDLYLVNDGTNQLYRNDSGGGFIKVGVTTGIDDGGNGTGGAWGDFNKDGWLDFYVVNHNQANRLYRNNGNGNRWLALTLEGSLSNRSGIGARVIAVSGNVRQRRDVDGGSGYFSQPSLPVEFGFGAAVTVDSIIVHWPSGQRQVLTQTQTNQHLIVSESDIPADVVAPTVNVSTPGTSATEGQSFTITAEVTDAVGIRSVWLLHRPAGAPTWSDSLTMERASGTDTYSATISGSALDRKGIEYVVGARDPVGNVRVSAEQRLLIRFTSLVSEGLNLPTGTNPTVDDFRMISIPALLTDPDPVRVLGQSLGSSNSYATDSWRLFRWNGVEYKEHPEAGELTPGKAFWVIAHNPSAIEISEAFSSADQVRSITLTPGWNQVGTPYLFPVSVTTLISNNPAGLIEPVVWEWNGSGYVQATELRPWRGYWVQNLSAASVGMVVPMVDADLATPKPVTRPSTQASWRLQIVAAAGGRQDTENYIGVHDQAEVAWDPQDISEPPTIGEGSLTLAFMQDEQSTRPGRYAIDMQSVNTTGNQWTFTVMSDQPDVPVTVSINDLNALPSDADIYLIDLERQVQQDIRTDPAYTFIPHERQSEHRFLIAVGTSSYVEDVLQRASIPSVVTLRQNIPNPFNPATSISFDLPAAVHVELKIYNVLGQEVRRLVDGMRPAGHHTVQWHGDNDQGRSVASGIYLYQLQAGSEVRTRKMILLR